MKEGKTNEGPTDPMELESVTMCVDEGDKRRNAMEPEGHLA